MGRGIRARVKAQGKSCKGKSKGQGTLWGWRGGGADLCFRRLSQHFATGIHFEREIDVASAFAKVFWAP